MPYLIGQCCVDQIVSSSAPSSASGLNEIIPFTNVSELDIPWNATRKARFGNAAVIYTEGLGEDGKYREVIVEWVPDSVINTTNYHGNFGGLLTGRVILT